LTYRGGGVWRKENFKTKKELATNGNSSDVHVHNKNILPNTFLFFVWESAPHTCDNARLFLKKPLTFINPRFGIVADFTSTHFSLSRNICILNHPAPPLPSPKKRKKKNPPLFCDSILDSSSFPRPRSEFIIHTQDLGNCHGYYVYIRLYDTVSDLLLCFITSHIHMFPLLNA